MALAAAGGLFGLMLHPLAIGHEERTLDRVVDHLEHAAGVIGIDRVCLGGDFTTRLQRGAPADAGAGRRPDAGRASSRARGSKGLKGPEDYPALLAALAPSRLE